MERKNVDVFIDQAKAYNIFEFSNLIVNINYSNEDFKILFLEAIQNNISIDKLNLMIQKYKHYILNNTNYQTDEDEETIPLVLAIQKNNYKLADLLIENGANIDNISLSSIIPMFNYKNSKYISNKVVKITPDFICFLIENKINHFLKYLVYNYVYDNEFILVLLSFYRNRKDIPSHEKLNKLIETEKNKIEITDQIYKIADEFNNMEAIDIIEVGICNNVRDIILAYIRSNNSKGLIEYVHKYHINLNCINYSHKYDINKDLLFYSIQNHASSTIMDYIIETCQYDCLNYDVCVNEQILPLLFAMLYRYNFKIFDYLIKKGADINHPKISNGRTIDYRRIVSILYENEDYRNKTIKYIFNSEFKITTEMINGWIGKNQLILLRKIFEIYFCNNTYVLNLLSLYRNKTPLTNQQVNDIIDKENKKLFFNFSCYEEALEKSNYNAINLLYRYDNREKNHVDKELFSLFHHIEKNKNDGKKLLFINKVKREQLKINVNYLFLENLYSSEEREHEFLNYINTDSLTELKNFLNFHELLVTSFNHNYFDILIYALENNVSFRILKYIISQYSTLNYFINESNTNIKKKYISPLFSVLSRNDFKVAQLLLKSGADVNYKLGDQSIISKLVNNGCFNEKIFKFLLFNGIKIDTTDLTSLKCVNNHDYLKFLLNYYIYDNAYIINFILLHQHHIALSDQQLYQIIYKKDYHLNIDINYDWFFNAFSYDTNLVHHYLDFGQYHHSSCFSETETYKILGIAIDNNEEEFVKKFLKSSYFNFKLFHLEELFSYLSSSSSKIISHYHVIIPSFKRIMNHSLFDFKTTCFEKIIFNIFEPITYKINSVYDKNIIKFINFFIKESLKHPTFDMTSFNFVATFKKILEHYFDVSLIKEFFYHESFDFKNYEFETIFSIIINNFSNSIFYTQDPFNELYKPIVDVMIHHKTFNYKTINFEKLLSCFSILEMNYTYIYLFLYELFHRKDFHVQYTSIEDILLSTFKYINFNTRYILQKIIDDLFEHETFIIQSYDTISKIISVAFKFNNTFPLVNRNISNGVILSDYILKKLLSHKAFKFNSETVEKILLSIIKLLYSLKIDMTRNDNNNGRNGNNCNNNDKKRNNKNKIKKNQKKISNNKIKNNKIKNSKNNNKNIYNNYNNNISNNINNNNSNNVYNNNNIILIEKLMNQLFQSEEYKNSSVDLNKINYEKILIKSIHCNDLYIMSWIFQNVINFSEVKLIHFEKILLVASKINNIGAMKFLMNKLLNITSSMDAFNKTKMEFVILKLKEIDTPYLTLIINILLKLNFKTFVEEIIKEDELSSIIDINVKDRNGEYPLLLLSYLNSYNQYIDIFDSLLNNNANMYIKDENGLSLFKLSLKNHNYSILYSLFSHSISLEKEIHTLIDHNNDNDKNDKNKWSDLIKAIYYNQIDKIKSLISDEKCYNNRNENIVNGFSPLTLSYLLNHQEIFKILVRNSTIEQLYENDGNGYSILHYALLRNDIELLAYFIHTNVFHYQSLGGYRYFNHSLLDIAIYVKNYDIFSFVLSHYPSDLIINKINFQSDTLLHALIKMYNYSNEEKIKWINCLFSQDKFNNINSVDKYGKTVLFYVCKFQYKSLIKLFMKKGAQLNESLDNTRRKKTTLSSIIQSCDISIIKYLVKNYRTQFNDEIIKEIFDMKNYELITTLFPFYLDIDKRDGNAFQCAYETKDLKIIKYILDCYCGLDEEDIKKLISLNALDLLKQYVPSLFSINMRMKYGLTPLKYAIEIGRGKIIEYLCEKGAILENKQNDNCNLSSGFGILEKFDKNIKNKVEFLINNNDLCLFPKYINNNIALKYVIATENESILEYFIHQGINMKSKEDYMNLLLEQSIKYKNLNLTKYLIENGADVSFKNVNGEIFIDPYYP